MSFIKNPFLELLETPATPAATLTLGSTKALEGPTCLETRTATKMAVPEMCWAGRSSTGAWRQGAPWRDRSHKYPKQFSTRFFRILIFQVCLTVPPLQVGYKELCIHMASDHGGLERVFMTINHSQLWRFLCFWVAAICIHICFWKSSRWSSQSHDSHL